jgi:signal transduction histidine kinase
VQQVAAHIETVLVVDDTPENLDLISQMLQDSGYRVRPAPNGKLALRAARLDPPDVILLDINMPEMDGYQVCRELKSDAVLKDIPVIFLSARMDIQDKVKAFNIGGVDYITKPFQVEEVLARIRLHLSLRRLQLRLAHQNTQLDQALRELKTTQEQVIQSEKFAALGVLIAGIAHEINNPINFIQTSITALQKDFQDLKTFIQIIEEQREIPERASLPGELDKIKSELEFDTLVDEMSTLFANIHEGIRRTQDIVSSLRILARQDDKTTEDVDIQTIIDASLNVMSNRMKNRIQVKKTYAQIPKLNCKPGKIGQLFTNIISNAIDALDKESQPKKPACIFIRTQLARQNDDTYIAVHITDNGSGIPEPLISKIFDPFFTTKDVGKGTGLGLYISQGIAKDHKGHIQVESSPSGGSTFSVFLPIKREKQ